MRPMARIRITVKGNVQGEIDVSREITIGRKPPADVVVAGRDPKQAKIVVQHPSVSSRHAKIRFDKGRFFVEDLKSVNGTFVDGAPVVAPTPIASEQALTFGTIDCLFVHKPAETGGGG